MGQYVLLLVVALTVGAVVFGVTVLVSGGDPGLETVEPDGRAVPLPATRPLAETDVASVRFDTAIRGYRMVQVDRALQRAAYDIGYKDELISVLEAEVAALREGRIGDAEVLRQAREAAQVPAHTGGDEPAEPVPVAPVAAGADEALIDEVRRDEVPAQDEPAGEPVSADTPAGKAAAGDDPEPGADLGTGADVGADVGADEEPAVESAEERAEERAVEPAVEPVGERAESTAPATPNGHEAGKRSNGAAPVDAPVDAPVEAPAAADRR